VPEKKVKKVKDKGTRRPVKDGAAENKGEETAELPVRPAENS
jgi:hypothetical protein